MLKGQVTVKHREVGLPPCHGPVKGLNSTLRGHVEVLSLGSSYHNLDAPGAVLHAAFLSGYNHLFSLLFYLHFQFDLIMLFHVFLIYVMVMMMKHQHLSTPRNESNLNI